MKHQGLLLTITGLFFCSITLFSQSSVGIKAGLNVANQVGGDMENDLLYGFNVGGSATFPLSNLISLQPEVLFTTKGCNYDFEEITENGQIKNYEHYDGSWRIYYLEIPLLVKFTFLSDRKLKPHLVFGPSPAFKVKGIFDEDYDLQDFENGVLSHQESGHDKGDIQQIKTFDMGFTIGAGVTFKHFILDARYIPGLWTISEKEDFEIRNSVFSVTIGYSFMLGK
jgi:hypothetical protein